MPADSLSYLTRPAAGEPEGLIVLFHGRGADEQDLFPLLDLLDPERRLLGVTPRGPLHLPPGGAHWYAVQEIGYPDPATFTETYALASEWLDDLAATAGVTSERTVLGGFSQGAVMTYALGLGEGRPRPAGLIALSGFMPTVPGFALDLAATAPTASSSGTAPSTRSSPSSGAAARAKRSRKPARTSRTTSRRTWRTRSTRSSSGSCRPGSRATLAEPA